MIKLSCPTFTDEAIEAVCDVLKSGSLVQGAKVEQLEGALSSYTGSTYAAAVSSGTAALHVALLSLGIGSGDAVLVPAFTFAATANVVEIVGARPVLVDVDPLTYCMPPDGLQNTILNWHGEERLKAVIPVHEFGAPCDMIGIMRIAQRHGLYVVEDAACALGTYHHHQHAGSFGDLGCFSFHPRKAITTGEGGALITNQEDLHDRIVKLRNHGIERLQDGSTEFRLPGLNYRLTELQAVLGIHQLRDFDRQLKKRQQLAEIYHANLLKIKDIRLPLFMEGHAWQTYMVVLDRKRSRRDVMDEMRRNRVETNLGAQAIHMLDYYKRKYGYRAEEFSVSAELFEQGLALPLHAHLTEEQVRRVSAVFMKVLG